MKDKNIKVEIDKFSGFCYGVIRAIETAEKELEKEGVLYSLGEIVHNNVEVERLKDKGLTTISHEGIATITPKKMLIRAHGEPPQTYLAARQAGIEIVDCTCPVVLKLQERIKRACEAAKINNGTIVIFGKKGHAEVNGLVGQTDGNAIVIETPDEIDRIDFSRPVFLFSQTTKSTEGFDSLCKMIENRIMAATGDLSGFKTYNTICRQVSGRKPLLEDFAKKHDVVVFVSGKQSSNGKVLYNSCRNSNAKSYFVENVADLNPEWFQNCSSVGVCGATSTPKWLMDKIAKAILKEVEE